MWEETSNSECNMGVIGMRGRLKLKGHQWCSCVNSGSGSCSLLVHGCFGGGWGPVVNEGMDVGLLTLQSSSIVFMPILAQAEPWEIRTWWSSRIKEPPID